MKNGHLSDLKRYCDNTGPTGGGKCKWIKTRMWNGWFVKIDKAIKAVLVHQFKLSW